jgi:hypothetical protein
MVNYVAFKFATRHALVASPSRRHITDCATEGRLIGIGAAVTRRPLPHHRTYGSVYGGSRSYANNPRITKEGRAT